MSTCWPHYVLERFDAVPTRNGRWTADCPMKSHRSAKLSFWMAKGGECLLFGCWAGCDKAAILARRGLTMRDLFPPLGAGPYGEKAVYRTPPRRIVETYAYRDEGGRLLYESVRYEPKDFRQRRPDGMGGWVWNLHDVRLVLYRLPELLAASPDAVVHVVEGERKCDALRGLGLVATTGAGGTGMGWQPGYSVSLRGRRCVIIPDNNAAGVRHAFVAAGSLLVHGAASLRVVPIPGLAEGEDVHDALKKGMTRAELVRIVRGFPEWRPCS